MKPADIVDALKELGWSVDSGPSRAVAGWKATIVKGNNSICLTDKTEQEVLERLLRCAQDIGTRKP